MHTSNRCTKSWTRNTTIALWRLCRRHADAPLQQGSHLSWVGCHWTNWWCPRSHIVLPKDSGRWPCCSALAFSMKQSKCSCHVESGKGTALYVKTSSQRVRKAREWEWEGVRLWDVYSSDQNAGCFARSSRGRDIKWRCQWQREGAGESCLMCRAQKNDYLHVFNKRHMMQMMCNMICCITSIIINALLACYQGNTSIVVIVSLAALQATFKLDLGLNH